MSGVGRVVWEGSRRVDIGSRRISFAERILFVRNSLMRHSLVLQIWGNFQYMAFWLGNGAVPLWQNPISRNFIFAPNWWWRGKNIRNWYCEKRHSQYTRYYAIWHWTNDLAAVINPCRYTEMQGNNSGSIRVQTDWFSAGETGSGRQLLGWRGNSRPRGCACK